MSFVERPSIGRAARRHPVAILLVYVCELLASLVVVSPVYAWARRTWGAHPEGDLVLFRKGGRELLVWLDAEAPTLATVFQTSTLLLVISALIMQLALGALIASLAFARAENDAPHVLLPLRPYDAMRIGLRSSFTLVCMQVLGLGLSGTILAIGLFVAGALEHRLVPSLGDASSLRVAIVVFVGFVVLAACVGIVVDLARAAVVREVGGVELATPNATAHAKSTSWSISIRALRRALAAARQHPTKALVGWGGRWGAGVILIAGGALAAHVWGGHEKPFWVLVIAHQLIALARVGLRASWLARALALIATPESALTKEADTSEAASVQP